MARECRAAIFLDRSSPTLFQQLDSLAHASHILVRANMEAAFGPRRGRAWRPEKLSNSRSYIQKQIDELGRAHGQGGVPMMQGDDIRNLRAEVQKTDDFNPSIETKQLLALWVIAEQLFELRAIAATFQEALQTGFGESNGYIRIQSEKGDRS